jgi:arginyl-tRNA synthetase
MNIFSDFAQRIARHIEALMASGDLPDGLDLTRLTLEPPRDASHGDLASNAAMVLAKPAGLKPRDLAQMLADRLAADADVTQVEIAGPGFLNITLKPDSWTRIVSLIIKSGSGFGKVDQADASGEKVNLEYVSANPTGPMHVGHARGAVVGDVLARLLSAAGNHVTKEYYINDAGGQVAVLAKSALLRMREAMGEDIGAIPEGLYPGDYLVPVGEKLAQDTPDLLKLPESEQIVAAKQAALPMMMEMIRNDLAALGVEHEVFLSEQSLHDSGAVHNVLDVLRDKGLVYQGTLEPPKGVTPPEDWEPSEQTLFRSSQFGDDSDRALMKSDGSWTYFAPDIACHYDKYQRGFSRLIDVWGADHAGYIKRMSSAVTAISDGAAKLEVKVCQMVKLQRDGQPVKMSKRSGEFITLREVVDEVGRDAVRFIMLTRKNDAPLDFDFSLVKQQSRDNPVFYVQYAHARCCSVLRNSLEAGFRGDQISDASLADVDLSLLTHDAETALIKQLASYPRLILAAADALEPHRLAFFCQEVAASFHSIWNLGKDNPELRFILEDKPELSLARLALLRATAIVIANCLELIGVEPQSEMR